MKLNETKVVIKNETFESSFELNSKCNMRIKMEVVNGVNEVQGIHEVSKYIEFRIPIEEKFSLSEKINMNEKVLEVKYFNKNTNEEIIGFSDNLGYPSYSITNDDEFNIIEVLTIPILV